jgi:hypothetical protein
VLERKLSRFTPVDRGGARPARLRARFGAEPGRRDKHRRGAGRWTALATSVRSPDGTLTASVVAAVPSPRFDRDRFAGPVRRAARSTEIGLAM